MGARGKKRRRADGSIAGAPPQSFRPKPLGYDEVEPVPANVMALAVSLHHRHNPLGDAKTMALFDWNWEEELAAMNALAEKENVDAESLGVRTDKLTDFLRAPENQSLFLISDEVVTVDAVLLQFAASTPMDNSNKPLIWPGQ